MLTWIEVDRGALQHNLDQFHSLLSKNTLLMPVVKSNAYGHGLQEVAKICLEHKAVRRICTVSLSEAIDLLKLSNKYQKSILILSFFDNNEEEIATAVRSGVIFPLYSLEQASILNKIGKRLNKKTRVHIKIDTGASRVGMGVGELLSFIGTIQEQYPFISIEALWSHLASSETNREYTYFQLNRFKKIRELLKQKNIDIPLGHIACTASTVLYPESHFEAVRIGLGIYGIHPSSKTSKKINLKPILSLYTKIIQIKTIKKGTKVGYGGTWVAPHQSTIAILPFGYFDGYDRRFSNKGSVVIRNTHCPVRGRICMNLMMVDVTRLKNIEVGDIVTIIGKGRRMNELAKEIDTIPYELVSRINPNIPRIYI